MYVCLATVHWGRPFFCVPKEAKCTFKQGYNSAELCRFHDAFTQVGVVEEGRT